MPMLSVRLHVMCVILTCSNVPITRCATQGTRRPSRGACGSRSPRRRRRASTSLRSISTCKRCVTPRAAHLSYPHPTRGMTARLPCASSVCEGVQEIGPPGRGCGRGRRRAGPATSLSSAPPRDNSAHFSSPCVLEIAYTIIHYVTSRSISNVANSYVCRRSARPAAACRLCAPRRPARRSPATGSALR